MYPPERFDVLDRIGLNEVSITDDALKENGFEFGIVLSVVGIAYVSSFDENILLSASWRFAQALQVLILVPIVLSIALAIGCATE